jgi:hypothetical protein
LSRWAALNLCGNYRILNETETFRIRRKPIHATTPRTIKKTVRQLDDTLEGIEVAHMIRKQQFETPPIRIQAICGSRWITA